MYNIHDKYSYVLVTSNTYGEDDVEYGKETLYEIMHGPMGYLTSVKFRTNLTEIHEIRVQIDHLNTWYISGEVAFKLFLVKDGKIEAFYQWELLYPKMCEIRKNM